MAIGGIKLVNSCDGVIPAQVVRRYAQEALPEEADVDSMKVSTVGYDATAGTVQMCVTYEVKINGEDA